MGWSGCLNPRAASYLSLPKLLLVATVLPANLSVRCVRVLLALPVVGLNGCFHVRQPEPATSAAEWTPATQPGILLQNFSRAVEQVNPALYERCFVPGGAFRYVADQDVASSTPGIFDQWRLDQERAWFQRLAGRSLVGAGNQLTFEYSPASVSFITPDSQLLQATYNLRLIQQDTNFRQTDFRGLARLALVRRTGQTEWKISQWQDTRSTSADHPWSEAKAYFFTH